MLVKVGSKADILIEESLKKLGVSTEVLEKARREEEEYVAEYLSQPGITIFLIYLPRSFSLYIFSIDPIGG
ncbi:hypothetical protein H5T87_11030 [bacterium]|nr:hypothetical protein [bacterium]